MTFSSISMELIRNMNKIQFKNIWKDLMQFSTKNKGPNNSTLYTWTKNTIFVKKVKGWIKPKQREFHEYSRLSQSLQLRDLRRKTFELYIQNNSRSKYRFLKSPLAIVTLVVPFGPFLYQNYMEKILGAGFVEPKGKNYIALFLISCRRN